jgi:hypothetical protein
MIPEARQNGARDRTSAAFIEYEAAAELCGPYFNGTRTALPSIREALGYAIDKPRYSYAEVMTRWHMRP